MRVSSVFAAALSVLLCPVAWSQPLAPEQGISIAGFLQPESVEPDPADNYLYVSNIVGSPVKADGVGYISRVRPDGSGLELKWISGLNAPKGLVLSKGRLYVADLHQLVVVDVHQGRIIARYPAAGAQMLNGIDVAKDGTVYVSDFLGNSLYRLQDGALKLWVHDDRLGTPNGISIHGNHLTLVTWGAGLKDDWSTHEPGRMLNVSMKDGSFSSLPKGPRGHWDGVVDLGNHWLVTNYLTGELFNVQPDGATSRLLKMAPGTADIGWDNSSATLWVPKMEKGMVTAYRFKRH